MYNPSSLFSFFLEKYRSKTTCAYAFQQNGKKCGHLYIQEGTPLSCYYLDFQGIEALEVLYQDLRSGIKIDFLELDTLMIYSENIDETNFEKILLFLMKRQRSRKIALAHSLVEKQEVSYWQ